VGTKVDDTSDTICKFWFIGRPQKSSYTYFSESSTANAEMTDLTPEEMMKWNPELAEILSHLLYMLQNQ